MITPGFVSKYLLVILFLPIKMPSKEVDTYFTTSLNEQRGGWMGASKTEIKGRRLLWITRGREIQGASKKRLCHFFGAAEHPETEVMFP